MTAQVKIDNLDRRIDAMRRKYPADKCSQSAKPVFRNPVSLKEEERKIDAYFAVGYPIVWLIALAIFEYTGSDGFLTFVVLISGFFLLPVFWCVSVWNCLGLDNG